MLRAKESLRLRTRPHGRASATARGGLATALIAGLLAAGCTTPSEYVHNGFKVGPEYCPPDAAVAAQLDRCERQARAE